MNDCARSYRDSPADSVDWAANAEKLTCDGRPLPPAVTGSKGGVSLTGARQDSHHGRLMPKFTRLQRTQLSVSRSKISQIAALIHHQLKEPQAAKQENCLGRLWSKCCLLEQRCPSRRSTGAHWSSSRHDRLDHTAPRLGSRTSNGCSSREPSPASTAKRHTAVCTRLALHTEQTRCTETARWADKSMRRAVTGGGNRCGVGKHTPCEWASGQFLIVRAGGWLTMPKLWEKLMMGEGCRAWTGQMAFADWHDDVESKQYRSTRRSCLIALTLCH